MKARSLVLAAMTVVVAGCSSEGSERSNGAEQPAVELQSFSDDLHLVLNVRIAADAVTAELNADESEWYLSGYELDRCAGLAASSYGAGGPAGVEVRFGSETSTSDLTFERMNAVGESGEGVCRYVGVVPLNSKAAEPITVRVVGDAAEVSFDADELEALGYSIELSGQ